MRWHTWTPASSLFPIRHLSSSSRTIHPHFQRLSSQLAFILQGRQMPNMITLIFKDGASTSSTWFSHRQLQSFNFPPWSWIPIILYSLPKPPYQKDLKHSPITNKGVSLTVPLSFPLKIWNVCTVSFLYLWATILPSWYYRSSGLGAATTTIILNLQW